MDQAGDPYGIAFIHAFRQRKDLIYMDVRWYYRFRDLPWQLQSKLDLDIKKNRAQCHSCDSSERKNQRKLSEKKVITKLKSTETVRLKHRELFASEILDTCLASFIVDRCCIVCYRDITEVVEFRPFADTFYYLFTYNPHHRRLASTQGEIRIGAQFQAEIPDLVSIKDGLSGGKCCPDEVRKQSMRRDADTSSEPCLLGSVRDDDSTCSSELSSEFVHAKRRRLLRSQSADDKCVSSANARKESAFLSESDACGEEVYRWCADLAEQRVSNRDFQTYITAVKTIALFCNTCEQGNARLISETSSSSPGVCESPWKRRRASDDYMKQCAFNALHDANYDLAKALDIIGRTSLVPPMKKLWTEEDQGEVIEFYYCWKKTVQGQMIRPKRRLKPMLQRRIRAVNPSNGEKIENPPSPPATDDVLTSDPNHDEDRSDEKEETLPSSKCLSCSFIPTDTSELCLLRMNKSNRFYCVNCFDHYNRYGEMPANKQLKDVLEFDETLAKGRLKDAMDSLLIKSHLGQPKDLLGVQVIHSIRHAREARCDDTPLEDAGAVQGDTAEMGKIDGSAEDGLSQRTDSELPDEEVSPVKSMEKMVLEATGECARTLGEATEDVDWTVRAESRRCDIELSHSDKYRGRDDSCARTDIVCISRIRSSGKRRRQRDSKGLRRPLEGKSDERAVDIGKDVTRVNSPNADERDDVSVESKSEQSSHSVYSEATIPPGLHVSKSPVSGLKGSSDDVGLPSVAKSAAQGKPHFPVDAPALRQLREMALARSSKYSERSQIGQGGLYNVRQRRPLSPQINPLVCNQQHAAALALQQYIQASMIPGSASSTLHSALQGGQSLLYAPPSPHDQSMLSPYAITAGFGVPGARQPEYDFNSLLPALTDNARMHPVVSRRQSPRAFQTHNHAHLHAHSHTHLHLNDNTSNQPPAEFPAMPHLRHLPFPANAMQASSISSNPFLAAALQPPPNASLLNQQANQIPGLGDFNLFGCKANEFLDQFRPSFPGNDNAAVQGMTTQVPQTPLEVLQAMGYPSMLQSNQAFPGMGSGQDNSEMPCLRVNGFPSNSPLGQHLASQWYQHLSSQMNCANSMPNNVYPSCQPQTLLTAAMIMRSAGVSHDQIQQHLLHYQQQQQMMMMNATGLSHTQLSSLLANPSPRIASPSLGPTSHRCLPRHNGQTQWKKESASRNGLLKGSRSQLNGLQTCSLPQAESPSHPDETSPSQPGCQLTSNYDQRGGSKRRRLENDDRISSAYPADRGPSASADRLD